jgi:hypothetical protein
MCDASVRTIGNDDEASLWTTTSHSTIGIDHLKQRGPKWYDIDSLMTPSLKPRDPAMAGVGSCRKSVVAAPPDLSTTRQLVETRIIPQNHPTRSHRTFSLVDFKAIAQGVDLPEKPVKHQVRGAEWTFHRDWGRSDHWERPLTPGSRPTTPMSPGSRPTTPGSRPATPGNRIVRDIP